SELVLLTGAPTWASSIWARWRKSALEMARRSSKEVVMPSNETSAARVQTLMTGLAFGESPRWHMDHLWFCNWVAQEVIAVDLMARSEVILHVPSFPFSIDWPPEGHPSSSFRGARDYSYAGRRTGHWSTMPT